MIKIVALTDSAKTPSVETIKSETIITATWTTIDDHHVPKASPTTMDDQWPTTIDVQLKPDNIDHACQAISILITNHNPITNNNPEDQEVQDKTTNNK